MINIFKTILDFLTHDPQPKKQVFTITASETIPEAFNYSNEKFDRLVNELTFFIKPDDRIVTFANYLDSSIFQQYDLDPTKPNHAAILGYAFCLAIVLQHELMQKTVINDVLNTFAKARTEEPGSV